MGATMILTEEVRRKISESRCRPLKLSHDELFDLYWNQKMTLRQIGERLNKSGNSIREYMKRRNIPRRTNSEAQKGKTISEEARKKMSDAHRGKHLGQKNPMYGKPSWNKGLTKETDSRVARTSQKLMEREISKEWREKLSIARMGKYGGENHPNWQGGLSDNPYGVEYNEKLRKQIRERDDFICQLCGGIDEDRELQTHHINYDKTDNHIENLISLCLRCHVKTNFSRELWPPFFENLILGKVV